MHALSWGWDRCEIGYWILGRHEGRGYMREAVGALTQALHNHGFNRVEIRCDPNNSRSSNIPRALGYQLEGRLHQVVKDGDGNYCDLDVFVHFKNSDKELVASNAKPANDFYTNEELVTKLRSLPGSLRILVDGYEGGFSEIAGVKIAKVKLNANSESYNGPHDEVEGADTDVIVIRRLQ
ncbi:MAG: GNAT family N-acetyltransferase [Bdellovibrionaceae bacterium]|nr:GNAT family N-acetyltransferase [Pseudobdellovibrionaceae bacterium]